MTKSALLFALRVGVLFGLAVGVVRAQDLTGNWQGSFRENGETRRVVVEIARDDAGAWKAAGCFVEFLHDPAKVESFVANGSGVELKVNEGKGMFVGTIAADSGSIPGVISGTWTWDGKAEPLVLKRAGAETAWAVPFLYQYHMKDVTYLRPTKDEARIAFRPKLAVDYMEQGALAWTGDWKCVACHTNGSYMVVRPLMTERLGPPQKALRDFFVGTLNEELATDEKDMKPEYDSTQEVYVAAGLAIWDANVTHKLSAETAEALGMMFRLQRADGDWTISDDNNPPLESNRYQLATVAARAVGSAPAWEAAQRGTPVGAKIELLKRYLQAEGKLQGDYDRVDLLWAAEEWPGLLDDAQKQDLVAMILRHQQGDGGWSIRTFARPEEWGKGNRAEKLRAEAEFANPTSDLASDLASDGHMTGLALIALRKAGVAAGDARVRRGVAWLKANERASGRWYTRSLNRDGWQFITYSGTVYPLLALEMCGELRPAVGRAVAQR